MNKMMRGCSGGEMVGTGVEVWVGAGTGTSRVLVWPGVKVIADDGSGKNDGSSFAPVLQPDKLNIMIRKINFSFIAFFAYGLILRIA